MSWLLPLTVDRLVSPQNSCADAVSPRVMGFGDGGSGRRLDEVTMVVLLTTVVFL